jgi:hypothetical protein
VFSRSNGAGRGVWQVKTDREQAGKCLTERWDRQSIPQAQYRVSNVIKINGMQDGEDTSILVVRFDLIRGAGSGTKALEQSLRVAIWLSGSRTGFRTGPGC